MDPTDLMHPSEEIINGYIEDALTPAERQDVERHLEACADCRELAADLREIRNVARSLDPREPPARAWSRLERAIQLDASHAMENRMSPARVIDRTVGTRLKNIRPIARWLAAAAALVVATLVGLRFATDRGRSSQAPAVATSAPQSTAPDVSAQTVEAELRAAEAHYDKAIKGLEQIATSQQTTLDPKTAATLKKNLAVIDQAISESRAAVRAQPTSEPAVSSLMDNFKTKLALLQDTVALINEMRKGNDAGAARAVSGLKQKGN
jgi:anti-sigma factor RsiW